MDCVKCGHNFDGNYCPQCGHKVFEERYTPKRIAADTIDTLDIREGFIRTFFLLFKNPGISIKNHLLGRSVMYNPLKLLVITGAISTYCTSTFYVFDEVVNNELLNLPSFKEYTHYSAKYFTFTNIVGIPIFALVSRLLFSRHGLNYIEHLVLNLYIAIPQLLMMIVGSIFFILLDNNTFVNVSLLILQNIYFIWVYLLFFQKSMMYVLFKTIMVIFIGYIAAFFGNYCLYLIIPQTVLEFFEIF